MHIRLSLLSLSTSTPPLLAFYTQRQLHRALRPPLPVGRHNSGQGGRMGV